MDLLQAIRERRSVREFTSDPVSDLDLTTILEAGCWAPSIRNAQPWRYVVIRDDGMRAILSDMCIYSTIIVQCPVLVAVYLDRAIEIDNQLAQQSIGAVIQNMLLTTESLGMGAVWLGDLRDSQDRLSRELGIGEQYQLAAMLAIGYPAHRNQKSHRKHVSECILKTIGG
jgi:nitroreductase